MSILCFFHQYSKPNNKLVSQLHETRNETYWKTSGDLNRRKYEYQYDHLNRLLNAVYKLPDSNIDQKESYQETIAYDKNGNITNLKRWGAKVSTSVPQMDDLIYTYDTSIKNGNRLLRVTDSKSTAGFKNGSNTDDDYAYDANGNMITDKNKGITAISYNQLNLPVKIEFGTNKIEYLYNATGQKMQKKVTQGSTVTTTDYLGGYQYKNNVLEYFPHAEGYVKRETSGTYNYVFNYTDHLGNVRISYSDTNKNGIVDKSNNEILEESNYYPFGLKHEGYNTNNYQANYKYKFQGQERQDELGLNWDSFKWRNYDYAIGRFMSIDPLSEKYNTWSPYTFSGNIVIHARELEGLEPHVLFGSLQEAGENFGSQYNGMSIRMDGEIGTLFYQTSDGKYAYTTPYTGGPDTGVVDPYMAEPIPKKTSFVGTGHTHGADRGRQFRLPGETIIRGDDDNKPSDIDVDESNKDAKSKTFQSNIVVTADGSIFIYGPTTNEDTVKPVNTNMPSDPRSPVRKNKVTPNNTPTVLPNGGMDL